MASESVYYNLRSLYFQMIENDEPLVQFPGWYLDAFDFLREHHFADTWNPKVFAFAQRQWNSTGPYREFPVLVGQHRVASRRVCEAIELHFPGCIEFLPFRVRTTTGTIIDIEYSLLHVLKSAAAVDRRKSVLLPGEKTFSRPTRKDDYLLDRVVVAKQKLVDPICRVQGWSPYCLFREDVVQLLIDEGFVSEQDELFEPIEMS